MMFNDMPCYGKALYKLQIDVKDYCRNIAYILPIMSSSRHSIQKYVPTSCSLAARSVLADHLHRPSFIKRKTTIDNQAIRKTSKLKPTLILIPGVPGSGRHSIISTLAYKDSIPQYTQLNLNGKLNLKALKNNNNNNNNVETNQSNLILFIEGFDNNDIDFSTKINTINSLLSGKTKIDDSIKTIAIPLSSFEYSTKALIRTCKDVCSIRHPQNIDSSNDSTHNSSSNIDNSNNNNNDLKGKLLILPEISKPSYSDLLNVGINKFLPFLLSEYKPDVDIQISDDSMKYLTDIFNWICHIKEQKLKANSSELNYTPLTNIFSDYNDFLKYSLSLIFLSNNSKSHINITPELIKKILNIDNFNKLELNNNNNDINKDIDEDFQFVTTYTDLILNNIIEGKDDICNDKPGLSVGIAVYGNNDLDGTKENKCKLFLMEAAIMKDDSNAIPSKIICTGNIGPLIKESAQVSLYAITNFINEYKLKDKIQNKGTKIMLHFPNAALRKDGTSAGIAICSSILSVLFNQPLDNIKTGFLGEISATGIILPVANIQQKIKTIINQGFTRIIIPIGNLTPQEKQRLISQTKNKLQILEISSLLNLFNILFTTSHTKTQ